MPSISLEIEILNNISSKLIFADSYKPTLDNLNVFLEDVIEDFQRYCENY